MTSHPKNRLVPLLGNDSLLLEAGDRLNGQFPALIKKIPARGGSVSNGLFVANWLQSYSINK